MILIRESVRGFRWACFGLSEWTTLIVYKWLLKIKIKKKSFSPFLLIVFNKQTYNPSLHDIMEKYYDMSRDKDQSNNKDFFNSPDTPDHSDQHSNTLVWPSRDPCCHDNVINYQLVISYRLMIRIDKDLDQSMRILIRILTNQDPLIRILTNQPPVNKIINLFKNE
jgi:predicted CopG family antitoxin